MTDTLDAMRNFLRAQRSLTVLTGAGISTASGIPDYRDEHGASRVAAPIQYPQFIASEAARRRYWARSFVGWQRFGTAAPNAAHRALAKLEAQGRIALLVTQNVDGLHQHAGSRNLVELHGNLAAVACTDCAARTRRVDYQRRLQASNSGWHARVFEQRPDGDADLAEDNLDAFVVPGCADCGGVLKPDVVMFGENVPRERVARATRALARSDALLVVGSSLMVYSGFRFARQAAAAEIPIAIVNLGHTRADTLAEMKIAARCEAVLPGLLAD